MPFMTPELTQKLHGYSVQSSFGISFLPGDILPFWPADSVDSDELAILLEPYTEGEIYEVERIYGYFGRYSAPGYLDATDWLFDVSKAALVQELDDLYGPDEEPETD